MSLPKKGAEAATSLAAQGAIMTIVGRPAQHFLVGDFRWVGTRHVYWFAANGDSSADVHLLEFDAICPEENRVHFLVGKRRVAVISAIADTAVDDPDDFLMAWKIWQQVAPMRHALMARSREACAAQVLRRGVPASTASTEVATQRKWTRHAGRPASARSSRRLEPQPL